MAAESIPPLSHRESELVLRVRAGERQLFHELVRPYERAVFITTYGILRDHADAEDAAQETMLKALIHLNQLANPEKFKGWLLQIAVNEARLKRRGKHGNLFEPLDGDASQEQKGRSCRAISLIGASCLPMLRNAKKSECTSRAPCMRYQTSIEKLSFCATWNS